MTDPYRPAAPAPHWQPPPPRRGVPWWTWAAVGGTVLLVGVAAALVPDTGGGHTAGTPSASPVTRSAKAAVSKAVWPPHGVPVTRKQLGAQWPFKGTTRGLVACVKDHPRAIIFNPGDGPELGKPFALNGTALDAGYPDVPKRIWLPDPVIGGGAKISVGPLQDRAPNRCQR